MPFKRRPVSVAPANRSNRHSAEEVHIGASGIRPNGLEFLFQPGDGPRGMTAELTDGQANQVLHIKEPREPAQSAFVCEFLGRRQHRAP